MTHVTEGPIAGPRPTSPLVRPRKADRRAQSGANQYDLGSFNEATIIETIRQAGVISRTEVAERTGLTQQSVSRILRVLLDRGLVVEGEQVRTEQVGKPRTTVRLRAEAAHAAGVLADPTSLTFVLSDLDGGMVDRRVVDLGADVSPNALVDLIGDSIDDMVDASGIEPESFLGVGVATPGPITPDGSLLELPLSRSWRNVPLRDMLEARLGCPVIVQKDGEAAAVGERWVGRTKRSGDFVFLYFGTGIGSGLVLNGDVYRGISSNAGEFGQLCAIRVGRTDDDGRPVLVRECNPTAALPEIAKELGYAGPATTYRELCEEVGKGEAHAVAAAEQIASVIAQGAVALIDLLDLPLMVIGGPVFEPELQELVVSEISREVNAVPTAHSARKVRVERSVLQGEAGALGAASSIFHNTFAPRMGRMQGSMAL
ncbi:ROK family protein [Planctomonas sp. JC2975]|uniref:ROK family transcriptional regulator n=1 Tax=Planctomonas sp. JC2975 TaxID=2729626 RepID=UPI0014730143|nr:ROK family protein [Planctomonas sp. JC2975]NNC13698.1 ROK family protein [Planctomonas sp. JC2975]